MSRRIAVNRGELVGSFGDMRTDFPMTLGMIVLNGFDPEPHSILRSGSSIASLIENGLQSLKKHRLLVT